MEAQHQPQSRGSEERRRRSTVEGPRSAASARGHGVRVLARVRPLVSNEEEPDVPCLRPVSSTQLEVLLEPRALLTDSICRTRRRTIGSIPSISRSSGTLSDNPRSMGLVDSSGASSQQGARGLESRTFSFDKVFDASVSDDQVFDELQEEIKAAVEGEAVCILAYGATGSGKTHTVSNLAERTAKELDRQAESLEQEGLRLELQVQIVEIYNEQFRDLLVQDASQHEAPRLKMSTPTSSASLQGAAYRMIMRDGAGGIMKSLQAALRFGQAQRATSSTSVHGRSSRSHLVMMLYLVTCNPATGCQQRVGRLSLVDLAGSERIKSSEATGDRLKEAQHINRSLSALADVVVAKEKGVAHVPYRNSKLTHLLQDALGGQPSSRTVIIVALPPTRIALGETLHSLQLSSRLNSIAVQRASRGSSLFLQLPGAGSGYGDDEALRLEADRLRIENARMRSKLEQVEERERIIEERERELEELSHRLEAFRILQAEELRAAEKLKSSKEGAARMLSGSPPSPVPEADSSIEKSAELEKSPGVWASTPGDPESSPSSNGQVQPQPEPEAQPADDLEELSDAQPEVSAHAVDKWESFPDEKVVEGKPAKEQQSFVPAQEDSKDNEADVSSTGGPEPDGSPSSPNELMGSWKWIDPRDQQDTSALLPSVPSPARRRRSSATAVPAALFQDEEQGSGFPLASSIEHQAEQDEDEAVLPKELEGLGKEPESAGEAKTEEAERLSTLAFATLDAEDELALAMPSGEGQGPAAAEATKADPLSAAEPDSLQSHLAADEAFIAGTSASDLPSAVEEEVINSRSVIVPVASGKKAAASLRSRSANARSPREYIVEAISPERVEKLTRSAIPWTGASPSADPCLHDEEFSSAATAFLMLSSITLPTKDGDKECDSPGVMSCGRVSRISESSDEDGIKDRMIQALLIRSKPQAPASQASQASQAAQAQGRRPQMSSYVRGVGPAGLNGAGEGGAGASSPTSNQASSHTPCHSHPGPPVQRSPRPGSPGTSANQAGTRVASGGSWSSYRVPPMPRLGSPVSSNSGRPSPVRSAQHNTPSVAAAAAAAAATGHMGTPRSARAAETLGQSGKAGCRSASSSPRGPYLSAWSGQVGARHTSLRSPGATTATSQRGCAQGYPGGSSVRATTPRVAAAAATSPGSSSLPRTPQRAPSYMAHSLVSSARMAAGRV